MCPKVLPLLLTTIGMMEYQKLYSIRCGRSPSAKGENPEKMERLAEHLAEADYLIFYSNRTYGSIARVPERYPLSARYYRLLFSGELGYVPERAFTSYPHYWAWPLCMIPLLVPPSLHRTLLKDNKPAAVVLNLGYADDNVVNYDHSRLYCSEMKNIFLVCCYGPSYRRVTLRISDLGTGVNADPSSQGGPASGGTWSGIITREAGTNRFPVVAWLLLLEVITLAALP